MRPTDFSHASRSGWIIVLLVGALVSVSCSSTRSSPVSPQLGAQKMFSHEWEGYQKLYAAPDEMPDLVGGLSGFLDRLTALRGAGECPSGRIVVQFIIGESGTVLDSATREGEEHPCEALAVRTIRESKFIPGKEDGKPVKTVMSLPVTFK